MHALRLCRCPLTFHGYYTEGKKRAPSRPRIFGFGMDSDLCWRLARPSERHKSIEGRGVTLVLYCRHCRTWLEVSTALGYDAPPARRKTKSYGLPRVRSDWDGLRHTWGSSVTVKRLREEQELGKAVRRAHLILWGLARDRVCVLTHGRAPPVFSSFSVSMSRAWGFAFPFPSVVVLCVCVHCFSWFPFSV